MNLLAFETSSDAGSVALLVDEAVSQAAIDTPRRQTEQLLPLAVTLLEAAGLGLSELDGIAFGRGPGSFTGLRVAAAAAQGLGLATGLPLLPVSSLAVSAQGVWRTNGVTNALICIDAHMGEVFWGAFEVRDGLAQPLGSEHLTAPQAVNDAGLAAWTAAGDGFAAYETALASLTSAAVGILPGARPHALDLLPLAGADLAGGRGRGPEEAGPVYLRSEAAWRK